jgi:hypothetical protein
MDWRGGSEATELVGSTEAANRLGVSSERIRQMAKAGQLPPPVGHLGRQDVWRWSDLETWAISAGRLEAEEGAERQPVRAWQPGTARRRRTIEQLVKWSTHDDAVVHVRVWEPVDSTSEPPVVLLGDLEDARSVSNSIEEVVATVAQRLLGERVRDTQFYEYATEFGFSTSPVFHHVTFAFARGNVLRRHGGLRRRDLGLSQPQWRPVEAEEIERLTGETLEIYTPGSYTIELVKAALEAGEERITAVLDLEDATRCAQAALTWDAMAESANVVGRVNHPERVHDAIGASLAHRAVTGRELAAKQLTWQDPDAPIILRVPELARPDLLRAKAVKAEGLLEDHDLLWSALSAVRLYLSQQCERDRLVVVPAVTGGYSRLAWWEAGVPEEESEPRWGLARLEPSRPAPAELSLVELCRLAETTLGRFLHDNCKAFTTLDIPAFHPSGPLSTAGPATQMYLGSIAWDPKDRDHVSMKRLEGYAGKPTLDRRASVGKGRFGRDGGGAGVLLSDDGKTFYAEWPVGTGYGQLGLETRFWADPPRRGGPAPVFLFDESGIRPLPSSPRRHFSADFTWGYAGSGPRNLADAILDTIAHLLADRPEISSTENWPEVVEDLVQGGRTPGWQISDIVDTDPNR